MEKTVLSLIYESDELYALEKYIKTLTSEYLWSNAETTSTGGVLILCYKDTIIYIKFGLGTIKLDITGRNDINEFSSRWYVLEGGFAGTLRWFLVKMKTIIIMIGIQGSGKSTFCKNFLTDYKRINLDTLKTRHQEQEAINECLVTGESFVIDNTNPTKEERKKYIIQAQKEGYRIVGYFMESKIRECIERNNKREGKARIPAKAIAATSNKLQLPEYDEGFDELYFVKNNGNIMIVENWR